MSADGNSIVLDAVTPALEQRIRVTGRMAGTLSPSFDLVVGIGTDGNTAPPAGCPLLARSRIPVNTNVDETLTCHLSQISTLSRVNPANPGTVVIGRFQVMVAPSTPPRFFGSILYEFPVPGAVEIDHVEVVQAVQTADNRVPLIAGKSTMLLVFPRPLRGADGRPGPDVPNGTGTLHKSGAATGGIGPFEKTSVTAVGVPDRGRDYLAFRLPEDWTTRGEITLRATVQSGAGSAFRDMTVRFVEARDFPLSFLHRRLRLRTYRFAFPCHRPSSRFAHWTAPSAIITTSSRTGALATSGCQDPRWS